MSLFINSLLLALLATLLATVFGLVAALCFAVLPPKAKRLGLAAALLALALPPFVVVNCWLHYFGNTGVWQLHSISIYSLGAVVWLLALMLWPLPMGAALGAWRALDSAQLEAEPALRGAALFRILLWPAARNPVLCAAAFAFVLALNHFTIPAILQVKVLPVNTWLGFSSGLNLLDALRKSLPLIGLSLAALMFIPRGGIRWPLDRGALAPRALRAQLGPWWIAATFLTALLLVASVGLPIWQLASTSQTWIELPRVWRTALPVGLNSFLFASIAAALAVVVAILGASFVSHLISRSAAWVLWIFFIAPGTGVAVVLIWALNRPGLDVIYTSAAVVVIALALRHCGPVWSVITLTFRTTDPALLEAARLEGLRGFGLLVHAYWPRVAPMAAFAWYGAFLLSLWEVEMTTVLYPPGAETLALRIFNLLHYGHHIQVNALCLILLAIAAAPAALYATAATVRQRFFV